MNNRSHLLLRTAAGTIVALGLLWSGARAQTTIPAWRAHTPLPAPLAGHGAVLLPTGDVLIAGGLAADGSATRTSYLYSPATGTFRPTINQLIAPRAYHALIAVIVGGNARVFAIGGFGGSSGGYRGEGSVEVMEYDAAAGNWRWRGIGTLGTGRGDLRAAWDGSDYIVVSGGYAQAGGALRSGGRTTVCDRINVATLAIESIGAMSSARAEHATARIIGDNGTPQVLVAGGEDTPAATATQLLRGTAWDPIANPPLAYHTAAAGIGDIAGIARVFGGFDAAGAPLGTCEWYDAKRGWRTAPRMASPRARFDAALVAGVSDTAAAYLAAAGTGTRGAIADAEIFHLPNASAPNGSWTPFASLITAGSERRVTITGNNLPLVTGGRDAAGNALAGTEIFQPLRANDIAFGDEEVGRLSDSMVLGVENTWLLPVNVRRFRITGSAEFSFRGDTSSFTIPGGAVRTIRVYFQPSVAGTRSGMLLFDIGGITDTVRLTGRGIASQLGIINSPLDFGPQLIATRRTACGYVMRNNGTDTTVIDSIVITPAGAFRLLSPLGRAAIAPGDSLEICVEFAPGTQGSADATATIHIAARSFSLQVLGKGIRRYLTASVISAECDTVQFAPGAESSGFITLENHGDTTVHVGLPTLTASTSGLFRFANPAAFPLDIPPGGSVRVEVIFSPQREAREGVTADFPNNGDTAAASTLCFVARSRFLSVSQAVVDLGSICIGDTATASVTIENPGGFDSVALVSAAPGPAGAFTLAGFTPRTLGPREYVTVTLRYIPTAAGPLAATLDVQSSRGPLSIPITGTALPAARFSVRGGSITIGDSAVLGVDVQGLTAAAGITSAQLTLEYDPKLIMPLRVASLAGAPPIDAATSTLRIDGHGTATLDIHWPAQLTGNGAAFALVAEALRGDGTTAAMALRGQSGDGFCITRSATALAMALPCGGSSGAIRTEGAELVSISPSPASETIAVTVVTASNEEVRLEMLDMYGSVVAERRIDDDGSRVHTLTLPVGAMPGGSYIVRARAGARMLAAQKVMIAR